MKGFNPIEWELGFIDCASYKSHMKLCRRFSIRREFGSLCWRSSTAWDASLDALVLKAKIGRRIMSARTRFLPEAEYVLIKLHFLNLSFFGSFGSHLCLDSLWDSLMIGVLEEKCNFVIWVFLCWFFCFRKNVFLQFRSRINHACVVCFILTFEFRNIVIWFYGIVLVSLVWFTFLTSYFLLY